jgi:hypothetical protein
VHNKPTTPYPPDPLRRFVPTPLRAVFDVDQTRVVVQTNDFSLLPELPLSTISEEDDNRRFEWKIVRDYDAPGTLEKSVSVASEKLTTVTMGPACLVAVDHERHELIGFIGAEVDVIAFRHVLLPLFYRLTATTSGATGQGILLGDQESSINA